MLARTLALALLAGCAASDAEVAPAAADAVRPSGVAPDTADADLSAIPADLRRCVASTVRDPGRRFEVVGQVERGGTRYVLVEAYVPDGTGGVFTFDPRLLVVDDLPIESERCQNRLVIGAVDPEARIREIVGDDDDYAELIRQAAASEVARVGGARSFEALHLQSGRAGLRECGAGETGSDGCVESDWATGYRAAGVEVASSGLASVAGDLSRCVPAWADASGSTAELTARADVPGGELVLIESIRAGQDPVDAAVSFRPVLLRLRDGACESLLPERTDNFDLRAHASASVVGELLRESAAWHADRAGGTAAYAQLLREGYGGALVECAERSGEAGFCIDPDRAEALRAVGVPVARPDR